MNPNNSYTKIAVYFLIKAYYFIISIFIAFLLFSGGYVFFVPPFADMYVFDENFSDLTASLSGLNVVLSGGGTDLQRIVSFDFLTDNFALNE